jgi:hypothetical protein
LEELINEMTYVNKGKTLIQNRRISVNFRDKCLLEIYDTAIVLLRELHGKLLDTTNNNRDVCLQALSHCLSLSNKCLNFEFIGVMLDETLAENVGTHFPLTWRDTMQQLSNTNAFFEIAMLPDLSENIYATCLQCLAELAS